MTVMVAVAAFFCGAFAVTAQAYLAREFLVVFLGNEMSLAVLLAAWLAAVAVGARIARSRFLAAARPAYLLALCLAAWVVLFPACVLAVRVSRTILAVPVGTVAPLWTLAFVAVSFVGPVALMGGFAFVTLCTLAGLSAPAKRPVGLVYVAEAAGGVAGGVLFTFLLAGRRSPFAVGLFAYVVMAAVVLALSWLAVRKRFLARGTAVTLTVGTVFLAASAVVLLAARRDAVLDQNSTLARMQSISQGLVVDVRETPYQNLTTVMLAGQYTVFGNGEALATFPELLLNEKDAYSVLAEHPDPKRILVLGGGPAYLSAVLSYGVESLDYVELDPDVVAVCRPLLDRKSSAALASPRVSIYYRDARDFLKSAPEDLRYDVVIVRTPDPSTLFLNRLYTREFMLEVRARMNRPGVFVLPVTLADGYLSGDVGRYAGFVHRTLKDVFDDVLVTPDVNSLFLASVGEGVLTSTPDELTRRFDARGIHSELFPPFFAAVFPPELTASVNTTLAGLPPGPPNTDFFPMTYAANLAIWARFADSAVARWVLAAARAGRVPVALAVALLAFAFAVPAFLRPAKPTPVTTAVLYTGFTAMSTSVLLIYAFQVLCGYVYAWIAALTAAFVAGLSVGGAVAASLRPAAKRLLLGEILCIVLPLSIIAVLGPLSARLSPREARWIVLSLAVLAGFSTGFEFPIAAGLLKTAGVSATKAASSLQVRDQLGACVGALLAGVVIVPAVGIWWSLGLLALVKLFSAAAVLLSRPPSTLVPA